MVRAMWWVLGIWVVATTQLLAATFTEPQSLDALKTMIETGEPDQRYEYQITAGNTPQTITVQRYQIDQTHIGFLEQGPGFTQFYLCDATYAVLVWGYEMPESGIAIYAKRTPHTIHIHGIYQQKPYEKTHKVDPETPWFQALDYSFPILSQHKIKLVYQLRPRDLVPTKMIITQKKDGAYPVLEGKTIQAHRYQVRIKGFMGFFWSQTYWVSPADPILTLQKTIHTNPKIISTLNLKPWAL